MPEIYSFICTDTILLHNYYIPGKERATYYLSVRVIQTNHAR